MYIPAAVSLGVVVVDVDAGGVLFAFATPTCEESGVATRIVELFGVPCSGEWGGELKLPGELPTSMASMARKRRLYKRFKHSRPEQQQACR